jgi:hypothetical protein
MVILLPAVLHAMCVKSLGVIVHNMTKQNMQNSDMDDDDSTFTVNYHNIIKQNNMLSITRLLASVLTHNPYMRVGDFIKNLSDIDLETLVNVCDDEHNEHFEELLLIAEMLSVAEGLDRGTIDLIHERTNHLITLIAIESLGRKGLVKVHHDNMSFGADMGDKIIVEKLDD